MLKIIGYFPTSSGSLVLHTVNLIHSPSAKLCFSSLSYPLNIITLFLISFTHFYYSNRFICPLFFPCIFSFSLCKWSPLFSSPFNLFPSRLPPFFFNLFLGFLHSFLLCFLPYVSSGFPLNISFHWIFFQYIFCCCCLALIFSCTSICNNLHVSLSFFEPLKLFVFATPVMVT